MSHEISNSVEDFISFENAVFGKLVIVWSVWYYKKVRMGYNYWIADFQCVLGISQSEKRELFLETARYCQLIQRGSFCW